MSDWTTSPDRSHSDASRDSSPSYPYWAENSGSTCYIFPSDEEESQTLQLDESKPPTPKGEGRPENFRVMDTDLYRSSYPTEPNLDALRALKLKTIVTLVEQHPFAQLANEKFREENDIAWHNIILTPNKPENPGKPKNMEPELVVKVVKLMMDSKNRPTLIHCNKGKHRSGCVSAIYRRATGWSIEAAIDEYVRYAGGKEREADKKFIQSFDMTVMGTVKQTTNELGR